MRNGTETLGAVNFSRLTFVREKWKGRGECKIESACLLSESDSASEVRDRKDKKLARMASCMMFPAALYPKRNKLKPYDEGTKGRRDDDQHHRASAVSGNFSHKTAKVSIFHARKNVRSDEAGTDGRTDLVPPNVLHVQESA